MKADPLGYPRNPLAVYLLALALFSGLLNLAGLSTSRSIDDALPQSAQLTWAGLLTLGSTASLLGVYWPGSIPTGLVLKRVGMFTLGVASTLYAVVLVVAFGWPGFTQAGIILGLALACALHYRQINDRIAAVVEATQREEES